ncbi:MFS general substrate transporter [Roridomyces roridus]|uniref:MFS general substrate transporter n=1 Tax=Roridomyces roridus TaxID=1738132 RepID=A0AAD7B044_9AGAR|nr:MFS general substrate transporter [Roridomyces roridus]KAJ7611322.1 MFS general substrate transporter [Roridomyces roridus]
MSSHEEEVELASRVPLPASSSTLYLEPNPEASSLNESALPPTDKGSGAWSFLAAAFVVEAVVWGFPNAYGVFLESYLQDPRFSSQQSATSLLPLIGTLSTGIIYCSGPFINPIAARYPQHRRKSMWFGAALCCATLFTASYANKINQLVLLQGVFYAIGGSLLYLPCISYMSEWFVARRGIANGILFAGTAVGGLLLPLILPPLISRYGSSSTLRILSISIAVLLIPLLPFVKGRLPLSRVNVHGPVPRGASTSQSWMKNRLFLLFLVANTIQSFAYFVPIVYLPTFASDLRVSSSNSAATLALLNGASVVGRLSMGYLSDKINPWILALSSLFTTSVITFILWGVLSHSLPGLLAFGLAYGSSAGGWSSLWTSFVQPLAKDDPSLSTTLYGYLLLSRGIGNIVSTPISAKLYSMANNATGEMHAHGSTGFTVGEGRFQKMIIYVGTCFAGAAGIAVLGWAMDRKTGWSQRV